MVGTGCGGTLVRAIRVGATLWTVTTHEMSADDTVALLDSFDEAGVDICVGGGWAVDANLRRQTRPHGDLDIWLPADHFDRAVIALVAVGVDRLYPWGDDRPWNFVLHDGSRRRVDLHVFEAAEGGLLHYGGRVGETFPSVALDGHGEIAGRPLRCEDPGWSLRWHTGYPPRVVDHHDVAALCSTFGFDPPPGFG